MGFEEGFVVETETVEAGEAHVGDEHVGFGDQLLGDGQPVFGGEIEGDAAFGPVVHLEYRVVGHVGAEHPLKRPGRVAGERLDLDHVGAPVGEDPARGRTSDPHADLDYLHSLEWSWHGSLLCPRAVPRSV